MSSITLVPSGFSRSSNFNMDFVVVMTMIGVISLARIVVNGTAL